jgi:hypothetical protein
MLRYRHLVLGLLILLFAITYIDRVCISVAGPRMQEELGIDASRDLSAESFAGR